MSLNNISLPASLIVDLYPNSLVETGEITSKKNMVETTVPTTPAAKGLRTLGDNRKHILVVVNIADAVHLPDQELAFLTNMLTACKLSLADVAIVNINQQAVSYKELLEQLKGRSALLFDIEPSSFGLPMSFPHFQIQPFAGCSFLYAPSLGALENDRALKTQLWTSLKRLFNI